MIFSLTYIDKGEQEWQQAPPGHPEWHRHGYLGPCLTGLFIFWCGEMKTGLSHGQHEVLLCEISRTGHFLRENLLSYSLPDWASLECWSALNLDPQSKMSETVKAYLMACIGNLNLVQVGWLVRCQPGWPGNHQLRKHPKNVHNLRHRLLSHFQSYQHPFNFLTCSQNINIHN